MNVRGFLAWYVGTVAIVSASGAVMWHGIQVRRHVDVATAIVPQRPAAEPAQVVADAQLQQPIVAQTLPPQPKLRAHRSVTAALPLPPLRVAPLANHTARVASSATQPWLPAAKRHTTTANVAAHPPSYQYSPAMEAQAADPYPGYGSAPYGVAYPPAGIARWQMQPYAYPYHYYPYRRYYARYPGNYAY